MKKGFLFTTILALHYSLFSQSTIIINSPDSPIFISQGTLFDSQVTPVFDSRGTFIFNLGSGGTGSSYSTGTGLTPPSGVTGTAADIRARTFSGSGYFTSGDQNLDTSFALTLGNGVDPHAASSAEIQNVPEPSAVALATMGAAFVFLGRAFGFKRAPGSVSSSD